MYWNDLGSEYEIDSHTLVVRLTDLANGRVNADAIRIVERLDSPGRRCTHCPTMGRPRTSRSRPHSLLPWQPR